MFSASQDAARKDIPSRKHKSEMKEKRTTIWLKWLLYLFCGIGLLVRAVKKIHIVTTELKMQSKDLNPSWHDEEPNVAMRFIRGWWKDSQVQAILVQEEKRVRDTRKIWKVTSEQSNQNQPQQHSTNTGDSDIYWALLVLWWELGGVSLVTSLAKCARFLDQRKTVYLTMEHRNITLVASIDQSDKGNPR
jgi:hypothetical protein